MSIESFLHHLSACSPEQFLDELPIFGDWLEEQGHALAERVRGAKPEWPEWTCTTEYGTEPRRYVLARYRESYPDDRLHFVAMAERLPDGSFVWAIAEDDGEKFTLTPCWCSSPRSGFEPSLREVNTAVWAMSAHLDGVSGVPMLREARSDFQAEVLGWFGWQADEWPAWVLSGVGSSEV